MPNYPLTSPSSKSRRHIQSNARRFPLESEEKSFSPFSWKHITTTLGIMYLFITVIGMINSYIIFNCFKINYFDYAEINDFLIGALKRPQAVIAWILVLLSVYYLLFLIFYVIRKICKLNYSSGRRYARTYNNLCKHRESYITSFLVVGMLAAILVSLNFTSYTVNNIITGNSAIYEVHLIREKSDFLTQKTIPEVTHQKSLDEIRAIAPDNEVIIASFIGKAGQFVALFLNNENPKERKINIISKNSIKYFKLIKNNVNIRDNDNIFYRTYFLYFPKYDINVD
jgi:hypothetical protein